MITKSVLSLPHGGHQLLQLSYLVPWSCGQLCSVHVTSTASPTDVALLLCIQPVKLAFRKHFTFFEIWGSHSLRVARHKMSQKPFIAYQYSILLTLPDRNMPPVEADTDVFHPVSYATHCQAYRQSSNLVDCIHVLLQSRDWNAILGLECNLRIPRIQNTISRFSDCAEHDKPSHMHCKLSTSCITWLSCLVV